MYVLYRVITDWPAHDVYYTAARDRLVLPITRDLCSARGRLGVRFRRTIRGRRRFYRWSAMWRKIQKLREKTALNNNTARGQTGSETVRWRFHRYRKKRISIFSPGPTRARRIRNLIFIFVPSPTPSPRKRIRIFRPSGFRRNSIDPANLARNELFPVRLPCKRTQRKQKHQKKKKIVLF